MNGGRGRGTTEGVGNGRAKGEGVGGVKEEKERHGMKRVLRWRLLSEQGINMSAFVLTEALRTRNNLNRDEGPRAAPDGPVARTRRKGRRRLGNRVKDPFTSGRSHEFERRWRKTTGDQ